MTFDPHTVWQQIGAGVAMNLGARDKVYSLDDAYVMFRVGAARPHRKIIVRYHAGTDLYDIEIGRLLPRNFRWVTDATADGIDAENLPRILLELHDHVTDGRRTR